MNEDLLDDVGSVRENPSLLFSKISLAAAASTILSFLLMIAATPRSIKVSEGHPMIIIGLLSVLIFLFFLVGVISSIIALVRREPSHWTNWVGSIANLLYLLAVIATLLFTKD
ncbi:MAG: hypothetical protein IAE84_10880 [Saprospiraceae bacterium]|nr:hypothetical protein [Saprospiraceae bacterium]